MTTFRHASAWSVALILLTTGCARGAHHAALDPPSPGPSGSVSESTPTTPAAPERATSLPPTNGSSPVAGVRATKPSPSPTYPQYVQGTKEAPVAATLDASCAMPGSPQTLTVTAPGGFYLSTDAQYSDGGDGRKYGGYYVGKIPASGTYKLPWVVAANAPLGKVVVWIAVQGGQPQETAFRQPTFVVAKSCH